MIEGIENEVIDAVKNSINRKVLAKPSESVTLKDIRDDPNAEFYKLYEKYGAYTTYSFITDKKLHPTNYMTSEEALLYEDFNGSSNIIHGNLFCAFLEDISFGPPDPMNKKEDELQKYLYWGRGPLDIDYFKKWWHCVDGGTEEVIKAMHELLFDKVFLKTSLKSVTAGKEA